MSTNERRWLTGLAGAVIVQIVLATLLSLTIIGGMVGWPWLWLSWSMNGSLRRVRSEAAAPSPLLLLQCAGIGSVVGLCALAMTIGEGEPAWVLCSAPFLVLYARCTLILERERRKGSRQEGSRQEGRDLGPAGVLC